MFPLKNLARKGLTETAVEVETCRNLTKGQMSVD